MPFDSLTLAPREKLEIAATKAGLEIIDLGLLERHMAAEVKRREPGWAYRNRAMLQVAFGIAVVAGFTGFLVLESRGFVVPAFAVAVALCGLVIAALATPMHGPARWKERVEPHLASVHPRIARSAQALREQLPEAEFRIGELFQERVKLDPYLIAAHGDTRLLLGIWDGDNGIVSA